MNYENPGSDALVALRRRLHGLPEASGAEVRTAAVLEEVLSAQQPDDLLTGLGGHGLAAVFAGEADGPTVLLRADLDALPIPEPEEPAYHSQHEGWSHKCGHDGHLAMLAGAAAELGRLRPPKGRAVLLCQPAEETGAGAQAVLDDERFASLAPDLAFAVHNLPGFPRGQVVVREGAFAMGSTGLIIRLAGRPAQAARPETGLSPAPTMARLIQNLESLATPPATQLTVVGAHLGEDTFGTTPGRAEIHATLRGRNEKALDDLRRSAVATAQGAARSDGLACEIHWTEDFPVTVNDLAAVRLVTGAAASVGLPVTALETPFPWSEDFGRFLARCRGALVGLGAGEDQPPLHDGAYDFPDEIIPAGVRLLTAIVRQALAP